MSPIVLATSLILQVTFEFRARNLESSHTVAKLKRNFICISKYFYSKETLQVCIGANSVLVPECKKPRASSGAVFEFRKKYFCKKYKIYLFQISMLLPGILSFFLRVMFFTNVFCTLNLNFLHAV